MSTSKPNYPAAHSMDTEWFAVDAAGNVAQFDTGEDGALPVDSYTGPIGESGLITDVAQTAKDRMLLYVDDLIETPQAPLANIGVRLLDKPPLFKRLFFGARPEAKRLDCLFLLRPDSKDMAPEPPPDFVFITSHGPVWYFTAPGILEEQLIQKFESGEFIRGWTSQLHNELWRLGVYQYECDSEAAFDTDSDDFIYEYILQGAPRGPRLKVHDLPPHMKHLSESPRLPVHFEESQKLDVRRYFDKFNTWGAGEVDLSESSKKDE